MKKLTSLIAAILLAIANPAIASTPASIPTTMNMRLTVVTNGPLDGVPIWSGVGTGVLQVAPDGLSALFVSNGAGTNTVTVTTTSQGNPLSAAITIIVTVPPATVLSISATAVAK